MTDTFQLVVFLLLHRLIVFQIEADPGPREGWVNQVQPVLSGWVVWASTISPLCGKPLMFLDYCYSSVIQPMPTGKLAQAPIASTWLSQTTFLQHLMNAYYVNNAKCFPYIILVNPHNDPTSCLYSSYLNVLIKDVSVHIAHKELVEEEFNLGLEPRLLWIHI